MRINVRTYGFKGYERKLFQVGENVERPQKAFLHAAEFLRLIIDKTFASQGRRGGGSWKKISEEWRERKVHEGHDPRILFMTHRLRNSLVRQDDPEQVVITTNRELRFGTLVPYAGRQNAARPFLKLTKGDREVLAREITSSIISPFKTGRLSE